jgi:hypothetical protein
LSNTGSIDDNASILISPSTTGARASGADRVLIAVLAVAIGIAACLCAFFVPRLYGIEELGVFNPPYVFARLHQLAFPAFGVGQPASFDRLYVHLPTHYAMIGALMRAGVSLYYAEVMPAFGFIVACLVLICVLPGRPGEKLGFLFGFGSALGLFVCFQMDFFFHLRPDAHMAMAWFAGLLLLENGRRREWATTWLLAGALVSTYASTLHYSGLAGFFSAIVYGLAAKRSMSWRAWLRPITALAAGAIAVGVPFVMFVLRPNWQDIQSFVDKETWLVIARGNFPLYRAWAGFIRSNSRGAADLFYVMPLKYLMLWGIPPFVVAALLLAVWPSTRVLALASLPLPLYLFFVATRKLENYLYAEIILALVALWIPVTTICWWAISRVRARPVAIALRVAFVATLIGAFFTATPELRRVQLRFAPQVHEMTIARAAAKRIVGPRAMVSSMNAVWYVSGGDRWYDLTKDLYWLKPAIDYRTYWRRFDAITTFFESWNASGTGLSEGSLYEDGTLVFKGFYFASDAMVRGWAWFGRPADEPVEGYLLRQGTLQQFTQRPDGDYVVATGIAVTPAWGQPPSEAAKFAERIDAVAQSFVVLPAQPGMPQRVVFVVVAPRAKYIAERPRAPMTILREFPGALQPVDTNRLLAEAEDRPMRFLRTYEEGVVSFARRAPRPAPQPIDFPLRRISGDTAVGGEMLRSTEIDVTPHTYYLVTAALRLERGSVALGAFQPGEGQPLALLIRLFAPADLHERFVVHTGDRTRLFLSVLAYNRFGPEPTTVAIDDAQIEPVTMTR